MGGRIMYSTETFTREKHLGRENVFHMILQDPESCRRLLLRHKLPGGKNERYISFIGYLKKMIMSREISQQYMAVKSIISALVDCKRKGNFLAPEEDKSIATKLLDNDFAEFLCEALPYPSTSCANDLLQNIYHCLALLSSNEEFFQFHAVYALESVLRSLHFVCQYLSASDNPNFEKENPTLSSGLALVAIILHGSVNKCNIVVNSSRAIDGGSVLDRISELIKTTMNFKNLQTKWKSGLVLRSLLNPWHVGKCFHWDNKKLTESVVRKKVCVSRNICTKGNEIRGVNEIQRRMPLFHGRVQLIRTKSTTEESEILSIHNSKYCDGDNKVPRLLLLKELMLVVRLLEESMKGLQNCLNGTLISNCYIKPTMLNQFLLLICQIGKNSLQLIPRKTDFKIFREGVSENKDLLPENDILKNDPFKQMFDILSQPIGGMCANLLVEMEFEDSSCNLYKEYLICLELLYLKFGNFCSALSHKLASQGYLTMLPLLLSSRNCRGDEGMKATCQAVLTHLLSKLAEVELNWPSSFVTLSQGLSNLPTHLSLWPSVMAAHSSEPSGIAVLIFSYFYCISSSRQELALPFLMPLVFFIKCVFSQNEAGYEAKELPAPILKALWFSFAISYLSNGCPVNPDIEDASQKLNKMIWSYRVKQKSGDICNIFTYHPALLLWVFSSPDTNSWLQLRVVLLWLQDCESSKSCQEIEKLLILNQDAFLCLMDIAEVGSIKVMECALRTLWSCLQNVDLEEREKISSNLWEILLHVIQRFCGLEDKMQRERAINVSCLLQLVQASTQSEPSSNAVIRLACLLNSALANKPSTSCPESPSKNQYLLYLSGLKMSHFLLNISLEKEDTRVASSMLSHYGLLQRLEWAANLCSEGKSDSGNKGMAHGKSKDNPIPKHVFEDLNSVAFLILAKLLFINPFHSQGSAKSILLNSWHLLNAVYNTNEDLCCSSLKLFHALVQVHVVKPTLVSRPFVRIVGNNSETDCFSNTSFIRSLYLQFVMLCAKVSPDLENLCWEFLSLTLQLPNKNLTSHLSKLPWNNSLINSRLPLDANESSDQNHSHSNVLPLSLLYFINQWLDNQRHDQEFLRPSWSRAKKNDAIGNVGSMILRKTISRIGKALVNENCCDEISLRTTENQNKPPVLRETILLVLKFEKDIPDGIRLDLKRKLSTLSV